MYEINPHPDPDPGLGGKSQEQKIVSSFPKFLPNRIAGIRAKYLSCYASLQATSQRQDELLCGSNRLGRAFDRPDQRRADDNAVRLRANYRRLFRVRNPEPHRQGQVRRSPGALDKFSQVGWQMRTCAGHASERYQVKEAG